VGAFMQYAAIMGGKRRGNQFRRLRGLSYFLIKKECGSRNMKNFYNSIFHFALRCTVWRSDFETETVQDVSLMEAGNYGKLRKIFFKYLKFSGTQN